MPTEAYQVTTGTGTGKLPGALCAGGRARADSTQCQGFASGRPGYFWALLGTSRYFLVLFILLTLIIIWCEVEVLFGTS